MLADRQTDKHTQTCSIQYFAAAAAGEVTTETETQRRTSSGTAAIVAQRYNCLDLLTYLFTYLLHGSLLLVWFNYFSSVAERGPAFLEEVNKHFRQSGSPRGEILDSGLF